MSPLTDRQLREVEYHRQHAAEHVERLSRPLDYEVLEHPRRRWWNAYWAMYAFLIRLDLKGKRILVVGCGFGEDALRLAKLGAKVSAFDLSPDSLALARRLAEREGLQVDFAQMAAEHLDYPDGHFDVVLARDILHHVEIPAALSEMRRVSRPGAVWVVNEIYSHSVTEWVRRSHFVENVLYPHLRRVIYGPHKPYITEDERKMTERDLALVRREVQCVYAEEHFNFIVTRILPAVDWLAKIDRAILMLLRPLGRFMASRILLVARVER